MEKMGKKERRKESRLTMRTRSFKIHTFYSNIYTELAFKMNNFEKKV